MNKTERKIMSMLKFGGPRVQKTKHDATAQTILRSMAVPVLVTVLGGWFAQGVASYYGRHQKLIAEKEAEEKFMTYMDASKNAQQRYLAIQSLIYLEAYETAADLLVTLPHDYPQPKSKPE